MGNKYHTIHSMSVDDCQQMIMDDDYLIICKNKSLFINIGAKKAYNKFIEQLKSLFGSDSDLLEMIDKDVLIQRMKIKMIKLINLKEGLMDCYNRKDVDNKIKTLDSLKSVYREMFNDYPKYVDPEANAEDQRVVTDSIIKPIESKIKFLKYKIKELSPQESDNKGNKDDKLTGLTMHIMFIQSVNPDLGYFDRSMSVYDMSLMYNDAIDKNNKLKSQNNG